MVESLEAFKVIKSFKDQIDKILNLHFFRKLAGKTQVILSLTGPTVRTRLTHTVEVARIARKLCDTLKLNSELAEAIALAHDLGHTPFGHVGERALKEIMCGCDTLKGRVNETDFENSGFKHNLQSFRVLDTLEAVSDSDENWPYILWGVSAHSKMSWIKPYSGMENEIQISCNHCDWVYSCFFHEKRECKRNIQDKKKEEDKKLLCRPSFCAKLDIYEERDDVPDDMLRAGDKKEDFLDWFKKGSQVWCSKKCYLSELSEHKMKNKETVNMFPYLFDHPFPNSFYGPSFNDYFGNSDKNFISVEALVVSQADEIAQRQQDLEDAISAGLIPFEIAKDDVEKLVGDKNLSIKNQKGLGEVIVKFYSDRLVKITLKNFKEFSRGKKCNINIYCLMNLLYLLDNKKNRKQWIIEQIKKCQMGGNPASITGLERLFNINYDKSYLYFVVCDFLEIEFRSGDYGNGGEILFELSKLLPDIAIFNINSQETDLISGLDRLRNTLRDNFKEEYAYFVNPDKSDDNNFWKNLNGLDLYPFYVIYHIHLKLKQDASVVKRGIFMIDDLRKPDIESLEISYDEQEAFNIWQGILKTDANSVLATRVTFTNKEEKQKFDEFNEKQKNYILKSELVEKNDGKANFILKRLFSAFITNSHQLPDSGLDFVLLALTDENTLGIFLRGEKDIFVRILNKLEKTTIHGFDEINKKMDETLLLLKNDDFDGIKSSNEIKALIERRKHLWEFIKLKFVGGIKDKLSEWVKSEKSEEKAELGKARLEFRGILDNPILNAMPYWKSLLARGICDYIASLTDLEAIDQYEKLYASVMELV